MDRKRKLGFIALMAAFIGFAIVWPVLNNREPTATHSNPTARLSDGRVIELYAVTYGTNHSISVQRATGNPFTRMLQAMFGGGGRRYRQTERHEVLIPWLIIPHAPGSKASPRLSSFGIVSDSGMSSSVGGRSTSTLGDDRRLVRSSIRVFPRRDEFLTLTGAVDRLPFSFRIKNPAYGRKFPIWTPDALPATNRAGDYRFVLEPPRLHSHSRGGYLSAKLKVFHHDQPVDHWFNTTFELSDPTGNRAYTLSTNETIWKTHFQMWKTFVGPWNTNDFRDFPLPEIPAAAGHQIIPFNDLINGFHLHRIWVGGPGRFKIENGKVTKAEKLAPGDSESWSSSSGSRGWSMEWARRDHWLLLETDRWPGEPQRISVFVRDRQGRNLKLESRGWSGGGGISTGAFMLKPPPAALRAAQKDPAQSSQLKDLVTPPLTIRIGIQTKLQTEFVVDITRLKGMK